MAGEWDEDTEVLVISTGLQASGLIDRAGGSYRSRAEFVDDWHTVRSWAADVPALRDLADWLLDQVALRDAPAQRLRAVLEPDTSDDGRSSMPYQGDRISNCL
ncbi:hypothetical protein ACIHEJ_38980 [Streptomyces sp. NPDC052301]|uniref:hypothetical protein n=1 Tax=Streptomyces sp. NPDC052301 TaxID=3365687 RepID=UPI0037D477F7